MDKRRAASVPISFLVDIAVALTGRYGQWESSTAPLVERLQAVDLAIGRLRSEAKRKKRPAFIKLCDDLDVAVAHAAAGRTVVDGRLFGLTWGILASEGNVKLPFVAYSELPGATCPGAGVCAGPANWFALTDEQRAEKRANVPGGLGWCYSFRGWRQMEVFRRQFLNTLSALVLGNAWPMMVMQLAATLPTTRRARQEGRTVFFRLFVDGDFIDAAAIHSWMIAIDAHPDIEVYGYSKSWHHFLHLDAQKIGWPANYRLNLSSGARWPVNGEYADAIRRLPIVRGSFVATTWADYVARLANRTVKEGTSVRTQRFAEKLLAAYRDKFDVADIVTKTGAKIGMRQPSMKPEDVRERAAIFEQWKTMLQSDIGLRSRAMADLRKDGVSEPSAPIIVKKMVALALDAGGVCPGVCGNCDDGNGVHRCASKSPVYQDRTIHIGLH